MAIFSYAQDLLDGYDISTTGFITPYISVEDSIIFSFQIVIQNGISPTGTLYVLGSSQNQQPINFAMDVLDGINITDNGQTMINLSDIGFKWVQLQYQRTSGTGQATVYFVKKTIGEYG